MMKHKLFLSGLISMALACCTSLQAQSYPAPGDGPISIGTTLTFHSAILDEDRKILVSLPDGYESSTQGYPVLYLLDAQYFFEFQYAYGLINTLAFFETIPELILVGVHSDDRNSDLIPASVLDTGRADDLIEFFREELLGFIDQQYRTEPYRILVGHSAGGLFAIHTLLTEPDTFNAYIALSPAVWTQDGSYMTRLDALLNTEREFNNKLFTSLASEGGDEEDVYRVLVSTLTEVEPAGLEFSHASFPDESHSSSIMPGIRQGLQAVYRNWMPSDSINSLDALLSHYRNRSDEFGYSMSVPMTHASSVGFNLINEDNAEEALKVFEYMLANIAQDSLAHYHVAFALRSLGRLEEALAEFDQAIALSTPDMDMYPIYIRFRDEVAQELGEEGADSE